MDENDPHPTTVADVTTASADSLSTPAASPKDTGISVSSVADATRQAKAGTEKLTQQASEKALMFADQGKERASGALEQLSQMLTDAAQQVDDRLGAQYGDYARTAAGSVQGFADQLRAKDVDDLVDDARVFVRKSPGVAIGAAATVGFVIARLVSAGIDQRDA